VSAKAVQPVHATLIAGRRGGAWQGALLRGPSGIGKSDLALRAVAAGWALVADDRVRLWTSEGVLYGAAPRPLDGLIEVRGLGVVSGPSLRYARVALVVDGPGPVAERMPAPEHADIGSVSLPRFHLAFLEAGAVARLDLALDAALRRRPRL
jgi:hypothetical protein